VRIGSFTGELVGVEGVRGYDLGRAGGDRPPDQLADIAAGFPEP
jgi:hypothetical protein